MGGEARQSAAQKTEQGQNENPGQNSSDLERCERREDGIDVTCILYVLLALKKRKGKAGEGMTVYIYYTVSDIVICGQSTALHTNYTVS